MPSGRRHLSLGTILLLPSSLVAWSCRESSASDPMEQNAAVLSWSIPSQNADITELGGYRIYVGRRPGFYTDTIVIADAKTDSHTINLDAPGTYVFAMTALDLTGNESPLSNEVSKTISP